MNNRLETRTSLSETCNAILDAARRAADVVRASADVSVRVPGLDWTLGEAAVHLAAETSQPHQQPVRRPTRCARPTDST